MQRHPIPPFYYPSMVVFVDDSRDFLDNLSLQLDAGLAFRLYESATEALTALNNSAAQPSQEEGFFSVSRFGDELPLSHQLLDLNLNSIVQRVQNPQRFEQVSVVVVDYDMPEIDGLALCQNIKNRGIKKILLTGKADEKLAVQAFNQGLIDRFILKQDTEVIPQLKQAIIDLQQSYFEDLAHTVLEAQGFLMLDASGAASLLIVKTADELNSHTEIAQDQAAPAQLVELLKSKRVVPYFPHPQGEYTPECQDWRACLYPASSFQGRERYYYATVPNPSGLQLNRVVSYQSFLQWLDRQK